MPLPHSCSPRERPWSGAAGQLAIAAGGLIVNAESAKIDAILAARLTQVGQRVRTL
jgi:flagellar biosynthesis/type III secretory pathway protein FliH